MNKNTVKIVWKVVTLVAGVIHTGNQFYTGRKQHQEFEDLKKAVAELQKKG